MARRRKKRGSEELRDQILDHFSALRVPLQADQLDTILARTEREGLSHLEFLDLVIARQAYERRERSIERRIRLAQFDEIKTLEDFDWAFNRTHIDRAQIETLATCDFVRRGENVVVVGDSGVGKSHLMQAIGRRACVHGYRVRYTTSAALVEDLTASLADKSLPKRLRSYSRFDLLIIDEFGFEKIERMESPQAASLLYKVVDSRRHKQSTILITNVDFEHWGPYLADPALAMALTDRIVDHAVVLRIKGRSYRAYRSKRPPAKNAKKRP